MKTDDEIIARINSVKRRDWLGVIAADLAMRLPYEKARVFLRDDFSPEDFDKLAADLKPPLAHVSDYLAFAWEKANNCRGLSAGRSLNRLEAWLWLAGFDDIVDKHFDEYNHYGKKQLVIASVLSGFDWRKHDNGSWVEDEEGPSLSRAEIESIVAEAEEIARAAMPKAA